MYMAFFVIGIEFYKVRGWVLVVRAGEVFLWIWRVWGLLDLGRGLG